MALQKVLVGSMWAFEEIGIEELQNEFKARYPEYNCVCEYSPDDHIVIIKSNSTDCTRKFASFIVKFIEEKQNKDLLDLPRIVRLDDGLFHENKSYHSEPSQDNPTLVAVGDDSERLVPHSLLQFAKYWQSSGGGLGYFGSAELFTTPNLDVLKTIEKATGTIISINKDLKNIKVVGWNIGDVDDAIGKLTRSEFALSVPHDSLIGNVLITSHGSMGRVALRKYSTLNSAALRRILTDVKPVSYIPLQKMFTTTFLQFNPGLYNYGKLKNLATPPSISRLPSEHGNSRIWSDYTFKGFGSGDYFRSLESASVKETDSSVNGTPDTSLPQSGPPSTGSHKAGNASDGFGNRPSAADLDSSMKPQGLSRQSSGLLDPAFSHLATRPIPDNKTRYAVKHRKPVALFSASAKSPTRPHSVPSSHNLFEDQVSNPEMDRPSQHGPSLKSAENKTLCQEESYRRSYRAFIDKTRRVKENRPTQASAPTLGPYRGQVPSREEEYRRACHSFIDKVIGAKENGSSPPGPSLFNVVESQACHCEEEYHRACRSFIGRVVSSNDDRTSRFATCSTRSIKDQTSRPDEGSQDPPRRIWKMKYHAPPTPEAAASDPAQQESVAMFDQDRIPIGRLRDSFNKFFDPTKYGHPLSVRESKGKRFHRTMQQQTGKPGGKPVFEDEKKAVPDNARTITEKAEREKIDEENKSTVPLTSVEQSPKKKEESYTNETIKSFFRGLKPSLDVAEYFQGSVNLEVQIGIVLIPRLPKTSEGSKITMSEWDRIFQPATGVRAPTTKFVNTVTSYGSEVDHIVDLKTSRNGSKVRLFEQEYSESHVSYEYHCRTRTNQPFTIIINEYGEYSIEMAPIEIGAVNLHFAKHIWDACVKVNGTKGYVPGTDPALEAGVKYLVDNAWIPTGLSRPRIFVRVPKENKFVVEQVFMKRWTRHRHNEHSKPRATDNDGGEGLFLQITEVHKLVIATSPVDPQSLRARSLGASKMAKQHRLWYEVSLVSSAIDTLLDSNKNLEVGERTEDWRADDLLGRYGILLSTPSPIAPVLSPVAEAIGTAGLGDLLNLTRKVVEKIDGIGFWNRGPAHSGRFPKEALAIIDSDLTVTSVPGARDKSKMMDTSSNGSAGAFFDGCVVDEPTDSCTNSEFSMTSSNRYE